MKVRAIILAGGEGTRLGVLTAKRTKPAVPFAGKYRIIDFPLSNCVNSDIFDLMIIAQYRPHSLIEHIGAGGPWDLNRDFTGGIRIYTPYKARASGWFTGTADAVQQNFSFIKRGDPDLILILSGDHIYGMDYRDLIVSHIQNRADMTMATIVVQPQEASRFGIVGIGPDNRVSSFVEKPANPPSNLANMGVYLFNRELLDQCLWEDHLKADSHHDFGKDVIPNLINTGKRVFAFPYQGYWVDVGTVSSYWQAHMDLLDFPPKLDLYNRGWIIHTRSEERAPVKIAPGAVVENSMICDGCIIGPNTQIIRSILSPGVRVHEGAVVKESIILTDAVVERGAVVERAVIDKRAHISAGAVVGETTPGEPVIAMVGKHSIVPENVKVSAGAMIGTDVVESDYTSKQIPVGGKVYTRRLPNEL